MKGLEEKKEVCGFMLSQNQMGEEQLHGTGQNGTRKDHITGSVCSALEG